MLCLGVLAKDALPGPGLTETRMPEATRGATGAPPRPFETHQGDAREGGRACLPSPTLRRVVRWAATHRVAVAGAALFLSLALAIGVGLLRRAGQARDAAPPGRARFVAELDASAFLR